MPALVVEPPAKLDVDLSRIAEMEPAKRQAVVDQQVPVRNIQRGQGNGVFLSEAFPEGNVEGGVLR